MYCKNCGENLSEGTMFCSKCGAPTENIQNTTPVREKTNGMAIAGFVCSFFIPILGWIFCGIGLNNAKKYDGKGKGLAIAGLIIASVVFILS